MIGVLGAGAFGTAMAVALGREGREVTLWLRDADMAAEIAASRRNTTRLPDTTIPTCVTVSSDLTAVAGCRTILLAMPMQALTEFLTRHAAGLPSVPLVACCKGVDLSTLRGPTALIAAARPDVAEPLVDVVVESLRGFGARVETGRFRT